MNSLLILELCPHEWFQTEVAFILSSCLQSFSTTMALVAVWRRKPNEVKERRKIRADGWQGLTRKLCILHVWVCLPAWKSRAGAFCMPSKRQKKIIKFYQQPTTTTKNTQIGIRWFLLLIFFSIVLFHSICSVCGDVHSTATSLWLLLFRIHFFACNYHHHSEQNVLQVKLTHRICVFVLLVVIRLILLQFFFSGFALFSCRFLRRIFVRCLAHGRCNSRLGVYVCAGWMIEQR